MAKKRTSKKKSTRKSARKSSRKKTVRSTAPRDKQPEYMVRINDPKNVRKDVLESLREVIIFMQGYETFLRIQEEKIGLFTTLKSQIKELNSLVDGKLRQYLPRGKLKPILPSKLVPDRKKEESAELDIPKTKVVKTARPSPVERTPALEEPEPEPVSELDQLERQLKDIESQLNVLK